MKPKVGQVRILYLEMVQALFFSSLAGRHLKGGFLTLSTALEVFAQAAFAQFPTTKDTLSFRLRSARHIS
jgi:hypothetical protein